MEPADAKKASATETSRVSKKMLADTDKLPAAKEEPADAGQAFAAEAAMVRKEVLTDTNKSPVAKMSLRHQRLRQTGIAKRSLLIQPTLPQLSLQGLAERSQIRSQR